ncbi:hypothetical protein [Paraflavitalea speifideaquila]|uniref:hypothetical protein n=1 Tax=Paraflavitalea speifideaquila TaxID=3076558 RepID=UPI0028F10C54|nr:hypothetical protein [Paraflavitalea speifideiaquila]
MKKYSLMAPVALLIIGIICTTAQAQTKITSRSSTYRTQSSMSGNTFLNVEADSVGDPNKRITMYKNGEVYKIRIAGEKITEMFIDDKKVAEDDYPKYAGLVKDVLAQLKRDEEQAARDRAQAELDRKQADRDREQANKDRSQAELDRQQADRDKLQAVRDRQQAVKDRAQAEQDRQQSDRDKLQAERDRQQAIKDRAQAEQDRQQADRDRLQAVRDREQAARDRIQADKDRAQAEIDRKQAEEDRKMVAALIDDLIKENVIKDKEDLVVLQLTDEALIINDKKQPAELHQRFKTKYLKSSRSRFLYTNNGSRRGFSVQNYD